MLRWMSVDDNILNIQNFESIFQMKVTQTKNTALICFDLNNEGTNNSEKDEDKDQDFLQKFIQPCEGFDFPTIYNDQIQDIKKRIQGFAFQYGIRNEKTTTIFLNLLEKTRQIGTNELKKKDYFIAASYYTFSLGFVDPDDQIYLQKFILTKIDILNKLMYCFFELQNQKGQTKYLEKGQKLLQNFLQSIKQYAFYGNLIKNESCLLQLNYFYLGNLYKKKRSLSTAIQKFFKAQQIIKEKQKMNIYEKNQDLVRFSNNLQVKMNYIISECFREEDQHQQGIYENMALKNAQKHNPELYQYLSREIRLYKKGKQFSYSLSKIEGKKKIEEAVLRLIDESKSNEICSLYDVYLDSVSINFDEFMENSQIGSTVKYF